MTVAQQARRAGRLLAEGTIRIGCVELGTFRPCRIPDDISRIRAPITSEPMNQDLSIVTLVLHASLVVQIVMVGLLLASLASWTVIFGKLFGLRKVRDDNDEFEREFWAGRNLNDLFADATKQARRRAGDGADLRLGHARVLQAAREARRRRRRPARRRAPGDARELPARARRDRVEPRRSSPRSARSRPTSACSARSGESCTPSSACRTCTQVTLATVAPGIAEALVATAIGLFAAIPAVIAYNRFAREIDRIAIQLESFIEEFSNILQRNAGADAGRRRAAA